ncbi:MAG: hypothetical protein ABR860_17795 [Terracidiphilus sp.]|jgi:hypothetical protein
MHSECRHIMPSGTKCHAAALRGTPYCYFHTRVHHFAKPKPELKNAPLKLPVLEDRSAIQLALAQILDALASARIDAKQAGLLLYGLQIASTNISGDASVPSDTVMHLTRTRNGGELAPQESGCDYPEDCKQCKGRDRCLHFRLVRGLSGGIHSLEDPDLYPPPDEEQKSDPDPA